MFSRTISSDVSVRLSLPQYADELYALTDANRAFLSRWLPWLDGIRCADDTREFIQRQLHRFADGEALHVTVFCCGRVAGVAGFNRIDAVNGIGYLGYWLAEEFNGRGIMTAVVADLVTVARESLGLQKVDIRCTTGNQRSRAIPERLGFSHEGTIRRAERVNGRWLDHEVYGLLLNDTEQVADGDAATGAG
ncbi:MAG: GNAT family N-acetyltransferase [Verrucomicrobiales bacterium]